MKRILLSTTTLLAAAGLWAVPDSRGDAESTRARADRDPTVAATEQAPPTPVTQIRGPQAGVRAAGPVTAPLPNAGTDNAGTDNAGTDNADTDNADTDNAGTDNGGAATAALDEDAHLISFQALLTDDQGDPLAGSSVDLAFRLYNDAGGLIEGPVDINNVPMNDGVVSVPIPFSPSSFDGGVRELGVRVDGGNELAPRTLLAAVPYAYRVDRVASEELDDSIDLGSASQDGALLIYRAATGSPAITMSGLTNQFTMRDADDDISLVATGDEGTTIAEGSFLAVDDIPGDAYGDFHYQPAWGGQLELFDPLGNDGLLLSGNPLTGGGFAEFYQGNGDGIGVLILGDAGTGSSITLSDTDGATTAELRSDSSSGGGASLSLENGNGDETVLLDADAIDAGLFWMKNGDGGQTVTLEADGVGSQTGRLELSDGDSRTVELFGHTNFGACFELYDRDTTNTVSIYSSWSGGDDGGGRIVVRDPDGATAMDLNAETGILRTPILTITGGSDLSERFDVHPDTNVKPGMVVSIAPESPGRLRLSREPYDHAVAGVISGAGGISTGMTMGQSGSVADGGHPVALSGRVYVWADATLGAIQPGNLLTTSAIPGHAMKVTDHNRSHGAIIGKAMTGLDDGTGLVLVLVSLQ